MTSQYMRDWLSGHLGREVTVSQVTIRGIRCYLADYVNHSAPATKLAGATEDEAIANLFSYLNPLNSNPDTTETKAQI